MLRDITLGQYYPADSVIHKLDTRVKLFGTLIYIISLFVFKGLPAFILAAIFLVVLIKLSKVPFSFIRKGLKPVGYIILLSVVLNLFTTPGEAIFTWKFVKITGAGVELAVLIAIRIMLLIVGSSIMTYTTTPNQLTDGIEKLFNWMNKLHIPVHEIAMMMSIALRFVPILVEELDKIMKAQTARGAKFNTGKLSARIKSMIPIVVPLFVSAIRRANDLAMAMESRCYRGGEGRTKLKPLKYARRDILFYGVILIYMCLMIGTIFI